MIGKKTFSQRLQKNKVIRVIQIKKGFPVARKTLVVFYRSAYRTAGVSRPSVQINTQ